jgi:hypothetical protein
MCLRRAPEKNIAGAGFDWAAVRYILRISPPVVFSESCFLVSVHALLKGYTFKARGEGHGGGPSFLW